MKPGKQANEGSSYRPISLLSPCAKILEAILLPTLQEAVNLESHQHGFRKDHSTQTALQEINQHILKGLNKEKPAHRTVLVAIDLSKAFDTVDHTLLLTDILQLELNDRIKRFLTAYLRGRQTYVEFRGKKSKFRKMRQGVPQGGVLSPILFNLYMSTLPLPTGNIKIITYADDGTVLLSGQHIEPICRELNVYLDRISQWFKARNLQISPSKSSATIFTTWSNEYSKELDIRIDGQRVPTVKNPKILGVTMDNGLTWTAHKDNLKKKLHERNNLLKSLASTSWGVDKETVCTTYKALGQSLLNYAAPIWSPSMSASNMAELQTCQNTALRVATGCIKMTPVDHLHAETKILPVGPHCDMLSKQFLVKTQKISHPNNINLSEERPRNMKTTITSRFGSEIKDFLKRVPRGIVTPDVCKTTLKKIHTKTVRTVMKKRKINKVLGTRAPEVNEKAEKMLPRRTRTLLAQLRSGYSTHLQSTMARIDRNTQPNCPNCGNQSHTTSHIFQCPAQPVAAELKDLWAAPDKAAEALGFDTRLDDND